MPVTMLCSQCGQPAERCDQCAAALCTRRLCAELHELSCAAVAALPSPPPAAPVPTPPPSTRPGLAFTRTRRAEPRQNRDELADLRTAEQLADRVARHRQVGRSALLVGDLDTAFAELMAARELELVLDHLGPTAQAALPPDWEVETDLVPLARALSSRLHPLAGEAWRRVLDDRPARSIQAEAAEWLARDAFGLAQPKIGLRILHASSRLGRTVDADAFHSAYRRAGLDPAAAFNAYLAAVRLEPHAARASGLCDPLTGAAWADQDPRWWLDDERLNGLLHDRSGDDDLDAAHQLDALHRARDLARNGREHGWLLLAEGDYIAGPPGVRVLGRNVRAGAAEPADHDAFVRIRLAYEGAADRLPDVAWPRYRLAELLAWAGFAERAQEHLVQAERRKLGKRAAERHRGQLRGLVLAGLGVETSANVQAPRPFPAEAYGVPLAWRLGLS